MAPTAAPTTTVASAPAAARPTRRAARSAGEEERAAAGRAAGRGGRVVGRRRRGRRRGRRRRGRRRPRRRRGRRRRGGAAPAAARAAAARAAAAPAADRGAAAAPVAAARRAAAHPAVRGGRRRPAGRRRRGRRRRRTFGRGRRRRRAVGDDANDLVGLVAADEQGAALGLEERVDRREADGHLAALPSCASSCSTPSGGRRRTGCARPRSRRGRRGSSCRAARRMRRRATRTGRRRERRRRTARRASWPRPSAPEGEAERRGVRLHHELRPEGVRLAPRVGLARVGPRPQLCRSLRVRRRQLVLGEAPRVAVEGRGVGAVGEHRLVGRRREAVELLARVVVVDVAHRRVDEPVGAILDAPEHAAPVEGEADLVAQPARPRRRRREVDRRRRRRAPFDRQPVEEADPRAEVVGVDIAVRADAHKEAARRVVEAQRPRRVAAPPAELVRRLGVDVVDHHGVAADVAALAGVGPAVHRRVGRGEEGLSPDADDAIIARSDGRSRRRRRRPQRGDARAPALDDEDVARGPARARAARAARSQTGARQPEEARVERGEGHCGPRSIRARRLRRRLRLGDRRQRRCEVSLKRAVKNRCYYIFFAVRRPTIFRLLHAEACRPSTTTPLASAPPNLSRAPRDRALSLAAPFFQPSAAMTRAASAAPARRPRRRASSHGRRRGRS